MRIGLEIWYLLAYGWHLKQSDYMNSHTQAADKGKKTMTKPFGHQCLVVQQRKNESQK